MIKGGELLLLFGVLFPGVMVIYAGNSVFSVLWLGLAYLCSAGLFLGAGVDFFAFVLLIIYLGAIMVLFFFVIMMLYLGRERKFSGKVLLFFVFVCFCVFWGTSQAGVGDIVSWGEGASNCFLVGVGLYLDYVECFVIGSYVLLVVMLGGIKLIEGFDLGGVLKQNVFLQGTRDI